MAIDTREKRFSMLNFGDGTHVHATFEADGTVDLDDRQHLLDCYSGIAFAAAVVEAPAKGKGRPTVTFIDRQAVLLWAELKVPDPVVEAADLVAPETTVASPAVPQILSGARAYRPATPTAVLVADAAAVLAWAELSVPSQPLELSPDEVLAVTMILED